MEKIEIEELLYSNIDEIVSDSEIQTLYKVNQIVQSFHFIEDEELDKIKDFIDDEIFKIPF